MEVACLRGNFGATAVDAGGRRGVFLAKAFLHSVGECP